MSLPVLRLVFRSTSLIQLVPAWLRTEGVGLAEIGFFTLIGLPYTWKFLWSPVMDRYTLPFLGRRRGWILVTQIALMISIAAIGFLKPQFSIWAIAYLAATIAFFSASQDIVLDAYRRELLADNELGLGNAIHVQAYRLSGLVPGVACPDSGGSYAVERRFHHRCGIYAGRHGACHEYRQSRFATHRHRERSRRRLLSRSASF